ncbi:MAG TPA: hypothetical protein VFN88_14340 [Caulobacteraceae bacterium]|nr:hypothetical protein [Caulobacteraceae bacterium]
MRRSLLLAAAAVLILACPVQAQAPNAATAGLSPERQAREAKIAEEAIGLFKDICLDRYPDEAAVETFTKGRQAKAMTADEVRVYLNADPGHGWHLTTPLGLYAVTIEEPPVRACAVRRMTPSGLSTASGYLASITAFAKDHDLTVAPTMQQKAAMGGLDVTAFASVMTTRAGAPAEQMILFLSNYHGRPPAYFAKDAEGGVGVEVRLVRQPIAPR